MTREKAIAYSNMTIEMIEFQKKYNPRIYNEDHDNLINVLKIFIETDRKYEALKLTTGIKQEPKK